MNGIHNQTMCVRPYDMINIVFSGIALFQRSKELPMSFYDVFKAGAE
jgi:hypothetical protein